MNSKRMAMMAAVLGLSTGMLATQAMAQATGEVERGDDAAAETRSDLEDSPKMPGVRTPSDDVNNEATVGEGTLRDDEAPDVVNDGSEDEDADIEDESPDASEHTGH
ncbi:hypothetical protein [Salinicola aestuarinus]|uniref:hypothetical protein n=1 Tax=Salinicola aestuarinus TaxID=1949082 RepID=UPI000DA1E146|nr:hypothetical protein [Salinicola aestuarinus]